MSRVTKKSSARAHQPSPPRRRRRAHTPVPSPTGWCLVIRRLDGRLREPDTHRLGSTDQPSPSPHAPHTPRRGKTNRSQLGRRSPRSTRERIVRMGASLRKAGSGPRHRHRRTRRKGVNRAACCRDACESAAGVELEKRLTILRKCAAAHLRRRERTSTADVQPRPTTIHGKRRRSVIGDVLTSSKMGENLTIEHAVSSWAVRSQPDGVRRLVGSGGRSNPPRVCGAVWK